MLQRLMSLMINQETKTKGVEVATEGREMMERFTQVMKMILKQEGARETKEEEVEKETGQVERKRAKVKEKPVREKPKLPNRNRQKDCPNNKEAKSNPKRFLIVIVVTVMMEVRR